MDGATDSGIARCLAEQRAALEKIASGETSIEDPLTRIWIHDWVAEEVLLRWEQGNDPSC